MRVRTRDGVTPLRPGHIALLAPTGAELWRYERALEECGLPIASQAGKGLFRRQEVQDLIALIRLLADSRDTLAFGAFIRGPLVGLTEEEILDIIASLPPDPSGGIPRLWVGTNPDLVEHPVARETLSILRELRRRHRSTTPMLLLSEAIERLAIRPILAARHRGPGNRALGNVDTFLELTRPYGVRGLKLLARDLDEAWSQAEDEQEGRIDAEGEAIELITVHSSKGLEWPVVIPINTGTRLRQREQFVHRQVDDTLHWVLGDVVPPSLDGALQSQEDAAARERIRLWYVACTRAMELLVLPYLAEAPVRSWFRLVDLHHTELPELDVSSFAIRQFSPPASPPNRQDAKGFEAERIRVLTASPPLTWRRPTDHDADRLPLTSVAAIEATDTPEVPTIVGQGVLRGLVLHKLMEEILTGELIESLLDVERRAAVLVDELATAEDEDRHQLPEPAEMSRTVLRTLALPEIARMRPRFVPEYPIYADMTNALVTGRADAVAFDDNRAAVVVDWKSDVDPSAAERQAHIAQMRDYINALAVERGAIVYMSRGEIQWLARDAETVADPGRA
jgi:CRISPR-associated exonuclease Cas4